MQRYIASSNYYGFKDTSIYALKKRDIYYHVCTWNNLLAVYACLVSTRRFQSWIVIPHIMS